jgi:hypothetical protein
LLPDEIDAVFEEKKWEIFFDEILIKKLNIAKISTPKFFFMIHKTSQKIHPT